MKKHIDEVKKEAYVTGKVTIEPATSGFRAPCADGSADVAILDEKKICLGVCWAWDCYTKPMSGYYIAHCLNNFQPLLDAMRSFVNGVEKYGDADIKARLSGHLQRHKEAIEAAEQVEVPE